MIRIVREESLRDELIEKGRERRKLFSWDHTAEKLWDSVQQVLDTHA
jgi:hypothetical protein